MPATFWTVRCASGIDLPLKVQAQTIKNIGTHDIYVFNIEDDILVDSSTCHAFPMGIISPGCTLDVVNYPISTFSNISDPDRDVTIHSDNVVHVEIQSSDVCDRWTGDQKASLARRSAI